MEYLTKEDIRSMVTSPNLSNQEILEIIRDELDIKIRDDLSREDMVEEIYTAYQEALVEIEANKKATEKHKEKTTAFSPKPTKKLSRKEFILSLIKEGKYSRELITAKVSEEYNYSLSGKSPKTRISRVIRELDKNGTLLITADGLLKYKVEIE